MTYRNNGSYLHFPPTTPTADKAGAGTMNVESPARVAKLATPDEKHLNDQPFVTKSQNVYDNLNE